MADFRDELPATDPRGSSRPDAPSGRFAVVGMGVAVDLVTLRGLRLIEEADLLLVGCDDDVIGWRELIEGRERLTVPHASRVYFGMDPESLDDPEERELARLNERMRGDIARQVIAAVEAGSLVVWLQRGDPMVFGNLWLLELMPPEVPVEVVPGIGAFQAGAAALQRSPVYGWDTNSVVLTMRDWPGRVDSVERLAALGTSMVFYTMGLPLEELFETLVGAYSPETPIAFVSHAGDRAREAVFRSTVGAFDPTGRSGPMPEEPCLLFVGKFLSVGQARKDGVARGTGRVSGM